MASSFDCVVVGAGIQGSCTALYLARAGKQTLLIDQFEQGHTRGSSHGGSRIIRYAYKEPHYAVLMPDAYKAWKAIEEEAGQQLITTTSLVTLSTRPPNDAVNSLVSTMRSLNLPHEVLDGKSLRERWPSLNYPDQAKVVVDPTAGILKADAALKAIQDLFVKSGGEMKWGVAVRQVVPGNPTVTLKTDKEEEDITCDSVVLCPGPWAGTLLASLGLELPLKSQPTGVFYWPEKQPGNYSAPDHPNVIDVDTFEDEVFALPAFEFPGLAKLCYHDAPPIDPNNPTITADEAIQENLSQYIRKFVPALEPIAAKTSTCFYTMTPDRDFILDRHPYHKNIVIGAGFSGTGFKLGPIVGKILGDLAMDQVPPYDITAFKISRF